MTKMGVALLEPRVRCTHTSPSPSASTANGAALHMSGWFSLQVANWLYASAKLHCHQDLHVFRGQAVAGMYGSSVYFDFLGGGGDTAP